MTKRVKKILCRGHTLLVTVKEKIFLERFTKKTLQKDFRFEKVIKRKGDEINAQWKGCDSPFNNWIDKKDIV